MTDWFSFKEKVKWRKEALCVLLFLDILLNKVTKILPRQVNFSAPEFVHEKLNRFRDVFTHMHWKVIVLVLSGFSQCPWRRISLLFIVTVSWLKSQFRLYMTNSCGAFTCLKSPISLVGKSFSWLCEHSL